LLIEMPSTMLESSSVIQGRPMPDERLDRVEVKIDRMTSSVDGLDAAVHKLTLLHEETRDDVKQIADGAAGTNEQFERVELSIAEIKSTMNSFIQTQSAINGKLRSRDADHERRIVALEKRPS
jgi:outer membrane murein-binding lipoprotein Lpp